MGAIRQGRYVLHVRIATASRRREHGAFLFVWSSDPIDFCPAVKTVRQISQYSRHLTFLAQRAYCENLPDRFAPERPAALVVRQDRSAKAGYFIVGLQA